MPYAPDLSGVALEGRYELCAVIGEGAFGRVYRARDLRLQRTVAVKLIKPWWGEDPTWAGHFEREARLLARLSDPGIVQIFDVGQAAEGLYFVSELIEGESLAARLARGPVPAWTAAGMAEQLCRALARAHAEQIVHRDVKPANILIAADGQIKVGDFGVARLAEGSSDGAGATVVGTPRYMAPEQARGLVTTPATDVYSVGIVLYEMLAGAPPFRERAPVELALRHLHDPPPPLPTGTPAALGAIVDRALAKAPSARFADAGEMARALAAARPPAPLIPGPHTARPTARPTVRTPPPRRRAPGDGPRTRVAPRLYPRRTHNPSGRRRSVAAVGAVAALALGMAAAAILIGGPAYIRMPRLVRLTLARATARTAAGHLVIHHQAQPSWTVRRGIVIAQHPRAGVRVRDGATIRLVLSAGPPPATVPQVVGEPVSAAAAALQRRGLAVRTTQVIAPGTAAGTVTAQSVRPGRVIAQRSVVALSVAEVPRWRTVTGVSGTGAGHSVTVRIRGTRWRVLSTMSYQGLCTFIVFCSGPSVHIAPLGGGPATDFDLGDGSGQIHVMTSGPGLYRLSVRPGSDTARWSITVQDDY